LFEKVVFAVFAEVIMTARLVGFLSLSIFSSVSCKPSQPGAAELSQSGGGKTFTVSKVSSRYEVVVQSGPCAKDLPKSALSEGYCFSETPIAILKPPAQADSVSLAQFCVDTSKAPDGFSAAAIAVGGDGKLLAEAWGDGSRMVIGAAINNSEQKIYVGFRSSEVGQKVVLRVGRLNQFSTRLGAECTFES
jgi:hypothetical protein